MSYTLKEDQGIPTILSLESEEDTFEDVGD